MTIETKLFGEIAIDEGKIITFPQGIIGFPDLKDFLLVHDSESEGGIRWMQSVQEPAFAMPVNATLAWNDLFSDRKIQNAAYWKIANVELGYNIPNNVFKGVISGARIYVSAQNLYTFTKYKGYNVDYAGGTFTPGYNWCSYPSARSFMAGVLFSF